MISPRPDLPEDAVGRPLTLAQLRELGVDRRDLEGPLWQRLGHGVRGWYDLDATDADVRIAVTASAQPAGTVIGGWAALRLHGVTALDGRTGRSAAELLPVLIHVGPDGRSRPTALLDVDRGELSEDDVVEIAGVRVATPTAACVAIARRYGTEAGLVAADAAAGLDLTSPELLGAAVRPMRGARGVRSARAVANLVDGRSASQPESRFRYVWVVEAGLPRPVVNGNVFDDLGGFAGRPDLLDDEAAFLGEYDGAQHRELEQHTADNVREEGFEQLNLIVARATSVDLWRHRASLVDRLIRGHALGRSRDRSRDRWRLVA